MTEPQKYGEEGQALFDSVTGYYGLTPGELRLLHDACQAADTIRFLEDDWIARGRPTTAKGSQGQVVTDPSIQEIRQYRNVLKGILQAMKLPTEPLQDIPRDRPMTRQESSQIANAARWGNRGLG